MSDLQPNVQDMEAHLRFLFDGVDADALIEIAFTDTTTGKLNHARLYRCDQIEAATGEAFLQNKRGSNLYVGVCPRRSGTAPFGRAADRDVLLVQMLWCDWDAPGCAENAKHLWTPFPPTLLVITGLHPHARLHGYWRIEPTTDFALVRRVLSSMAEEMNADPQVCNPGRVMRLAGTIAWPVKEGRVQELTAIRAMQTPGKPIYGIGELEKRFATASKVVAAPPPKAGRIEPEIKLASGGSLGITTPPLDDGRERYMRDTVMACLTEYIGQHGCAPDAFELHRMAWPQYAEHVDLTRPGRGEEEFLEKAAYAVRRLQEGHLGTLDEHIAKYQAKRLNGHASPVTVPPPQDDPLDYFPATDFVGEPAEQRWIAPQWIPAGVVSTLMGDGGVGKTLIAQQLLYAASVGGKWLGIDVAKVTTLGVLCEDERGELHRRHKAIAHATGHTIGNPYSNAYLWPRVGRDNLLLAFDQNHKPQLLPFYATLERALVATNAGLLILDTLADLYGGSEIDRAQVNYFLKAVCGGLILRAAERGTELTVLLLGHPSLTGRNTGTGESGSTAWNNAVRSRLYLTKPEDGLKNARVLTRKKANYAASGDDEKLELLWIDGVLKPQYGAGNNDERLATESAKQHILTMVKARWEGGDPYKAKRAKGTRFLDAAMMDELTQRGVQAQAVAAALHALKSAGEIVISRTMKMRGWALKGSGQEVE